MNPPHPQLELRLTDVTTERRPAPSRSSFHPVRLFVDMNLAARFWFVLFLLTLTALVTERIFTARQPPERLAVIDSSGAPVPADVFRFGQATNLHLQQARLATHAFLNRDPGGFDHPELLQLMFLTDAREKAHRQLADEAPEREAKQFHQKVEIGRVDLLETRDDRLLVHVTGQLIRTGAFQNRPLVEAVPFRLALKMRRNPDLLHNGRFPTAVADFRYETR